MAKITCQNLKSQLQELEDLKKYFDQSLSQASKSSDVKNIKGLKIELEDKILNLRKEMLGNPEILAQLEIQYHESLTIGAICNLYDKENPVIEADDGKKYKAPTWSDILFTLTHAQLKNIKSLKKPTLFLVPFGLPFTTIWHAIGNLAHNQKLNIDNNPEALRKIYPPTYFSDLQDKKAKDTHVSVRNGFTKLEVLNMQKSYNRFPGWQVLVMDTGPSKLENYNKTPESLLKQLHLDGFDIANLEEWFFSLMKRLINQDAIDNSSNLRIWINSYSPEEDKVITTSIGKPEFGIWPPYASSASVGCQLIVRIN